MCFLQSLHFAAHSHTLYSKIDKIRNNTKLHGTTTIKHSTESHNFKFKNWNLFVFSLLLFVICIKPKRTRKMQKKKIKTKITSLWWKLSYTKLFLWHTAIAINEFRQINANFELFKQIKKEKKKWKKLICFCFVLKKNNNKRVEIKMSENDGSTWTLSTNGRLAT